MKVVIVGSGPPVLPVVDGVEIFRASTIEELERVAKTEKPGYVLVGFQLFGLAHPREDLERAHKLLRDIFLSR